MADAADPTTNAVPEEESSCGGGNSYNGSLGLRVGALFIILVTSMIGTLFPILAKRAPKLKIPHAVWDFAKYFGAGVIIATAFIHLLSPALDALGSECLTGTWTVYPWALAISMMSVFGIFTLELVAFRLGMGWMEKFGIEVSHDTHGPGVPHGPERKQNHSELPEHNHRRIGDEELLPSTEKSGNHDGDSSITGSNHSFNHSNAAQIIGVAILEFGVVVHSVIIGLTLAVTEGGSGGEFNTLFVVIIFHQMFEGLGLGTRLAQLPLPQSLNYVPLTAGAIYAICTPLGMAIGLGVRTSFNPESTNALITQGTLDAISSGILLYTGLVELLAHEFLFNNNMRTAPLGKVLLSLATVALGCGIMSLLGRWA